MKRVNKRKSGSVPDDNSSSASTSESIEYKPSTSSSSSLPSRPKTPKQKKTPISSKKPIQREEEHVPKRPKTSSPSPPSLSIHLKTLGNYKVWADLLVHLYSKDRYKPVLIYGPTGCGKTKGIEECLRICNANCTLLDGSAPDSPDELNMWISQVCDNGVLEGEGGVLFIDDIESFTLPCREIIIEKLKKRRKCNSPLIMTCTDYYSIGLKDIQALFKNYLVLRCFSPNYDVLERWFHAKGYNSNILKNIIPTCHGDFRAADIALKWHYSMKKMMETKGINIKLNGSGIDHKNNIFELANSLLTRKNEKWFEIDAENSHTSNIRLLHENLITLLSEPTKKCLKDPLETCAHILDSFTHTSWNCQPELMHFAGLVCQHYLGCKVVSKKWILPQDKSNIILFDRKEVFKTIRDGALSRFNINETKSLLNSYYDTVYGEEDSNRPSLVTIPKSQLVTTIQKINPNRLMNGMYHSLYDVPSILGGLKLKI
jgi:hypothetical protein